MESPDYFFKKKKGGGVMQSAINEGNRILCSEDQLTCVVESETELKKSSKHLFVNPIIYLTYI